MINHDHHALDPILDRQKQAWSAGKRPAIEEFLQGSAFAHDPEVFLDLLYHEIVLREALGERPTEEEYVARYPQHRDELKLHFEVHSALQENLLVDTLCARDAESQPDGVDSYAFEVGPYFRDYELIAELGQGGMGVVYKARHRILNRLVAVKMFQPGRFPSPRELARFKNEAEAIARLQHPNIVQIFDIGQSHKLPFLALELAEQGTLAQKLQKLSFTPRAAAELIETLARAIQHAHEHHIVHRDLKPANVLFTKDGTPKITDFGLAKVLAEDASVPRDSTQTGEPMGTPRYMAPEQAAGRPDQIGPATDIYALGTVLYECLTGQVPFVSPSVMETLDKIRHDEPVSPRHLQPSIPRDLDTICLHCLQKQPERRYAGALGLAEDLRRFLQNEPILARPTPPWERTWKWCFRHPTMAAMASLAALVIFVGLIYIVFQEQRLATAGVDIDFHIKMGKEALKRKDVQGAKARFEEAWKIVLAHPALRAREVEVKGWLDHGLPDGDKQRWNRNSPPLFDELRDEAFVQSVLLDPQAPERVRTARQAIKDALEFAYFPADQEQLMLLDAYLLLREGEAQAALDLLDQAKDISPWLLHHRRADCLERLGQKAEANQERDEAKKFPPKETVEFFLSGIDRFHQHDLTRAIRDFDTVLEAEPNHFTARFFQAACFLNLKQSRTAKVALTACVGQRPRFGWNHLYRAQAYLQLNDYHFAAQDLQHAWEMNRHDRDNERKQQSVQLREQFLHKSMSALFTAIKALPEDSRRTFCNEKILTDSGLQTLRELPAFQKFHVQFPE